MSDPFFRVDLNIPHAARVVQRILHHLERLYEERAVAADRRELLELKAQHLDSLMAPYLFDPVDASPEIARELVEKAAGLARDIVDEVERLDLGDDRLGQAVRNFFECLELGQEGARLSLRAGENPNSLLRPF
jgi:hypothetical protein